MKNIEKNRVKKPKDLMKTPEDLESMKKKRLKITWGIPSATNVWHYKFVMSFYNLKLPENSEVNLAPAIGYQIPFARNHMVRRAKEFGADYLFMTDVDAVFAPDTLLKLLAHKKLFVNALAFRRQSPHFPALFKWREDKHCYETIHYKLNSGLVECDATGMHCVLIDMKVFEKLKKPYFYYAENLFSSDLSFCRQCKKAGIPLFVDSNIKTGHIGVENIAVEEDYLRNKDSEAIKKYNIAFQKELYERN